MSQRLRVADLANSRIPAALNLCPTDPRFYAYLNESEELLLNQGRWVGAICEAQFCVTKGDQCLVLPRQVATVERIAICGAPIMMENAWYGYTRQLATLEQCSECSSCSGARCRNGHLQFREKRQEVCSFATTLTTGSTIRFYPASASDVGKKIVVQGRDQNGIWVRKVVDGAVGDGEQVTLALPYVDTITQWQVGAPDAIIKEVTSQRVLMYEVTPAGAERALGDYEPSETNPSYRVGYIPGLANVKNCCNDCTTAAATLTVTCMVSLRHVPLSSPNDWLVLQNLSAYKAAMMAVKAWEEGDAAKGDFYFYGTSAPSRNARGGMRVVNRGGAIPLLQAELRKYTGDRCNVYITTDESNRMVRDMAGFI